MKTKQGSAKISLWQRVDLDLIFDQLWSDSISNLCPLISYETPRSLQHFNQICQYKQLPFQFVIQKKKIKAYDYYQHIIGRREIPINTKTNHDFLNALLWLSFPKTRWNILEQQADYSTIRKQKGITQRHPVEDRLTLFDESGIIVVTDHPLCEQLIQKRHWFDLFWTHRALAIEHIRVYILGHGLYEQLLNPFIGLVGYGRLYRVPPASMAWSHQELMFYLDQCLCTLVKQEQPLRLLAFPLLGVPNYWSSQDQSFYLNPRYFRGPYHH